ncbi:hypothetical protein Lal_00031906 [Lupinus albus]|nr:hypothetical protein Lal_00031906 [Lupinus albus]
MKSFLKPSQSLETFEHAPKHDRSKLDVKIKQCIFISYAEDEFGDELFDHIEKKVVRSRDVKFMEEQIIEDIDNMKNTKRI